MKEFEFKIKDLASGRVLTSRIKARNLIECKKLISIQFRLDTETSSLVGIPKEVEE